MIDKVFTRIQKKFCDKPWHNLDTCSRVTFAIHMVIKNSTSVNIRAEMYCIGTIKHLKYIVISGYRQYPLPLANVHFPRLRLWK